MSHERRSVAQVFVEDPCAPELSEHDAHHLLRVLRLAPGELVVAADGRGTTVLCALGPEGRLLEPVEPAAHVAPAVPPITVAFAPVKGDRPEWVVQKLTELGVDRIALLVAERSVVRWSPDRLDHVMERLKKVAREAAAQSRRAWLPDLAVPVTLAAAAQGIDGLAMAERGGKAPSLEHPAIAVGPEGGWEDAERSLGLPRVELGDTVLRSETAALAAATLLSGLRSGLVGPAPKGHG